MPLILSRRSVSCRVSSDRRSRGFSLVELLVVLVVVALLLGILLPVLAGARTSTQRVTCSGNLRQIGLVLRSYAIDFDEVYPQARPIPEPFVALSTDQPLYDVLAGYIVSEPAPDTNPVYRCPSDETVHPLSGISYLYSPVVSGKTLNEVLNGPILKLLNLTEAQIEVASDFDGEEGGTDFALTDGSTVFVPKRHFKRNILFGDGHVDIVVPN